MSLSIEDEEVQSYLGFSNKVLGNDVKMSLHAYTPGRLKTIPSSANNHSSSQQRRPASACSHISSGRRNSLDSSLSHRNRAKPLSSRSKQNQFSSKKIKTPRTPRDNDRFIPPRGAMNFDLSHEKILKTPKNDENNVKSTSILNAEIFEKVMSENINRAFGDSNDINSRVIQYRSCKTPNQPKSGNRLLGCQSIERIGSKNLRKISTVPERVLDAPNYIDDYYLNLLDWSASVDRVVVALDNSVYIWTPSSGDIDHVCEYDDTDYVSSVKWVEQGYHVAIGNANGSIEVWDTEKKKKIRVMTGHATRIGSLSWNMHVLSSGCRGGEIHNHDVRIAQHHISSFSHHSQEVCGLQWSPSGRYLASGCNNNDVMIWDWNHVHQSNSNYIHRFTEHNAAVKALAWCPWQHNILATGGGAADKMIRFWNVNSGNCLNSVHTNSQVSAILWSEVYKEVISGHGYPNNQLSIWKYPTMIKKADLQGHTNRVLQMVLSADKTKVMSASADETLRLWQCFDYHGTSDKKRNSSKENRALISLNSIR